jgi:hypothetical protein
MSNASDYLEVQWRMHLFRTGSFAKPGALYVSLHTANPTDAAVAGEVSGGSYARVQRNPADANWSAASSTDGITSNVADLTFPSPTANWGTITHWGIWDAASSGNLLVHGAFTTPRTVNSGDSAPVISAGGLTITVA